MKILTAKEARAMSCATSGLKPKQEKIKDIIGNIHVAILNACGKGKIGIEYAVDADCSNEIKNELNNFGFFVEVDERRTKNHILHISW